MSDTAVDYDAVSLIHTSGYRRRALLALAERPGTPTQIAEETGDARSHVSKHLTVLRDAGLVERLVSDAIQKGRYHAITARGASALAALVDDVDPAEAATVATLPPVDWDGVGWASSSQYRLAALGVLADGMATPGEIASASGEPISHISRALGPLTDRGYVELLVGEDVYRGRFYGLTDDGEALVTDLDSVLGGDRL